MDNDLRSRRFPGDCRVSDCFAGVVAGCGFAASARVLMVRLITCVANAIRSLWLNSSPFDAGPITGVDLALV